MPSSSSKLTQIVMNLVGNALQHSPVATPVYVEPRGEAHAVTFTVANQGRPIAPDLIAELCARLRRGPGARSPDREALCVMRVMPRVRA